MSKIAVSKVNSADNPEEMKSVWEIRRIVYIVGQNCPPAAEWEHDEESHFFLATFDGIPCGVSRWRQTKEGYKLERFAVLEEYRKRGVGSALMVATLADLPKDANHVYLNSQLYAMGLYAKFGFVAVGEQFDEVGIPHYKMVKVQSVNK